MTEYNWKLISSFSIPAGLVMGWLFTTGLNKFIKYIILAISLAIIGVTIHNLSSSQKKANTFTSLAIIVLIVMLFYLFSSLF